MNSPSLYLYRTELYNEWKDSDDCVTLEFEMWLIAALVRKNDSLEFAKGLLKAEKEHNETMKEVQNQLVKDFENMAANNQRIVRILAERDLEISKLKTELFNQLGVPVFDSKNANPDYFMGIDMAKKPDSSAEIISNPKPQRDGSNDTPQI